MTEKSWMAGTAYDVTTIGNAIVDVLAQADDAFIVANRLNKGAMTLIDAERAEELYGLMGPAVEISGGSASNTAAGVASLGGRAAYIGMVRDDQLGEVFRHDIRAAGVHFATPSATSGPPTARSFIIVTPDAERTMNTYLGACVELGPEDVDEALIAASGITYMEGYLYDKPRAKDAFRKAAAIAHGAGRKVSLTLSDSFCVHRHHADFLDLVERHVDVLFGNEDELKALYGAADVNAAVSAVRGRCELAAITLGKRGSLVVTKDAVHEVPAAPAERIVDKTGAGDLYAAGFLFGYTHGHDLPTCAHIGSLAASEIISHYGARPAMKLSELLVGVGA